MSIIIINKLMKLAEKAAKKNESPVAAIIENNGKIISCAYNTRNKSQKTINHAEIIAIKNANKKLKSWRLNTCTLYVTLEPCDMCKSVIKESRIEKIYYLLPRMEEKNQFNKSEFVRITNLEENELYVEKYKKILNDFWKNKR